MIPNEPLEPGGRTDKPPVHYAKLGWGLVLLVLGTVFLLDAFGHIEAGQWIRYWPLVPMALGAYQIATAAGRKNLRDGLWMLAIGSWLLINTLGLFGLWWSSSWPLILIAAGVIGLALPKRSEPRNEALWPLGIGLWALATIQGWGGLTWSNSWPLLVIFVGLGMVLRGAGWLREKEGRS
jgi:hypothetical protein